MATAYSAVSKAVSANNYKTKNSATILGAGNFVNGNITNDLSILENSYRGGSESGLPIVSTVWGRAKALTGGTFAYQAANKWIMKGNAVTLTISGVSNLTLKSGAADFFRKAIAFKTTARQAFLGTLSWTASSISGPRYTFTVVATNPSFGSDTEAALSRTERGTLLTMIDGKIATEYDYQDLTLF